MARASKRSRRRAQAGAQSASGEPECTRSTGVKRGARLRYRLVTLFTFPVTLPGTRTAEFCKRRLTLTKPCFPVIAVGRAGRLTLTLQRR